MQLPLQQWCLMLSQHKPSPCQSLPNCHPPIQRIEIETRLSFSQTCTRLFQSHLPPSLLLEEHLSIAHNELSGLFRSPLSRARASWWLVMLCRIDVCHLNEISGCFAVSYLQIRRLRRLHLYFCMPCSNSCRWVSLIFPEFRARSHVRLC